MTPADASNDVQQKACDAEILMPPRSRYAGQAVDLSSRRSVAIDGQAERNQLITADDSHATIDYFYHEGEFWRAVIPLDGVDEVLGQAFNFSRPKTKPGENGREIVFDKQGLPRRTIPILNHLQCRFRFHRDRPVNLYPLGGKTSDKPVHQIHNLVYSVEAVGPLGIIFNLRDAFGGNLLSAHRFLSLQEVAFERLVVENQYVTESPPLPLHEHEARILLTHGLLRSHAAGMNELYYLYRCFGTNNCTSNPFQIVDKVRDYNLRQRIGSMLYRFPLNPRLYLRVRGLDSDPTHRKLLFSEFEDYVNDTATQKRKRDYVRAKVKLHRAARKERAAEDPHQRDA